MSLPDYKELKKLSDACRKAGIKSFKCAEFEFTLTEDAPVSNYKRRQRKTGELTEPVLDTTFKSDTLTESQLLFWSTENQEELVNEVI